MLQTPRGAVYCVSQRAEHIWEGVSSATTRSRPIINTRDEPHADAERYRRLHVIVGDSNMNETTTLLKVAMTDLVLRMIEAGVPIKDMTLENPIRAIREISHDMTGRRKVRLANGREMSALEIQTEYHYRAAEFVDREGVDPVHRQMLELWGRVLKAVDTEDLSPHRPRDRLGDQVQPDRALPGQARPAAVAPRGSPRWTSPTTTSAAPAACTTCSSGPARSTG